VLNVLLVNKARVMVHIKKLVKINFHVLNDIVKFKHRREQIISKVL